MVSTMKLSLSPLRYLLIVLLTIGLVGCDETEDPTITNSEIDIAERLSILSETDGQLASLIAQFPSDAPLDQTFRDDDAGPFTVFAPTDGSVDAALVSLDANENDVVIGDEVSESELVNILQYHVIEDEVFSGDLQSSQTVTTLSGDELLIESQTVTEEVDGEEVERLVITLNDTQGQVIIDLADIEATNGVVHVISGFLLPN